MCLTLGVTLLASTTKIQLVLYSQYNVGAPLWIAKAYMYLQITLVFFTTFLHASNFYTSGFRCCSWLNLYFTPSINTKQNMYKTRNWPSSVDNYGTICILMTFQTTLGWLVFNLNYTPYKPDDIWSIIISRRIKYRFIWVTIQILKKALDSLEIR